MSTACLETRREKLQINIKDKTMGIIGNVAGGLIGMATAPWNDKRQLEQQKKLQKEQIAGAKEMGKFNQELAMQTWEQTNYAAQRKQMEKAGLNVGMMYGGTGSGGTTSGGSATMPTGGIAPSGGGEIGMGMQMGLAAQMQQAQIENIQANTQKTKADTAKTAGVDTEAVQANIDKLKADTENTLVNTQIGIYEKNLKRIESQIAEDTEQELIQNVKYQNDKLIGEIKSAQANGRIDQETADTKIAQTKAASQEQALRIAAQKAGLIKTGADIEQVKAQTAKLVQDIQLDLAQNNREWDKLAQKDREIMIQQKVANNAEMKAMFDVDTGAKAKRWAEILDHVIPF